MSVILLSKRSSGHTRKRHGQRMVRKELISEPGAPGEKLHGWVDKGRFL